MKTWFCFDKYKKYVVVRKFMLQITSLLVNWAIIRDAKARVKNPVQRPPKTSSQDVQFVQSLEFTVIHSINLLFAGLMSPV